MADLVERLRYRADEMDRRLGTTGVQADLREAADALDAMQWQLIETAPKDGKCLLAIETDDGYTFGVLERSEDGTWIHEGEPTFCKAFYYMPTHWMPLPAPPKEAHNG